MTRARELAELAAAYDSGGLSNMRNRIINGDMRIDQRNNGASVTPTSIALVIDRWKYQTSQASKLTFQRDTVAPAGFTNSLKVSVASAFTAGAADYFVLQHNIEGLNAGDLAWGTVSASAVTLSFWVRSSLTGTYTGCLQNATPNRSYVFSYSINVANTWEYKTITIAGDTTGTWANDTSVGIAVDFDFGSGSNYQNASGSWVAANRFTSSGQANFVGTNGATFYITGVQLEKGSTATSFDYRPYGTELQLCQRYLPAFNSSSTGSAIGAGQAVSTTSAVVLCAFPVQTRVAPTGISVSNIAHLSTRQPSGGVVTYSTSATLGYVSTTSGEVVLAGGSGGTVAGGSSMGYFNNASGQILFTGCEL